MIRALIQRLFGCPHRRISRPITPSGKPDNPESRTYVVCLDCGQQFAYDLQHMRMGERLRNTRPSTWS
jgi:hypothetical protein